MKNPNPSLFALAVLGLSSPLTFGAVLWSDNFDVGDQLLNDSNPPAAGRISGSLAGTIAPLESWGAHQSIASGTLAMINGTGQAGARWGAETGRVDWAAAAGTEILAAGGFTIAYDWNPGSNTNAEWISLNVGTINGDSAVNAGGTDYGILIRNAFSGTGTVQHFDNGAGIGETNLFTPMSDTWHAVVHTLSFDSFADGSLVDVSTTVDGIEVASYTFDWDGNSGAMHMELGTNTSDHRIDNLVVSTIPEPSASLLALLALGGTLATRRRR